MIQRVYVDTSVIGGLFDDEFADDTRLFFDKADKGEIKIIYSEITVDELADAPGHVRKLLDRLTSQQKEFVEITQESTNLADTYIMERVVGKTSRADWMHIAGDS